MISVRIAATIAGAAALGLFGCGAADAPVAPDDLEVRDLLGIAPARALAWDAGERAAARAVLELTDDGGAVERARLGEGATLAALVSAAEAIDRRRRERGEPAIAFAEAALAHGELELAAVAAAPLDAAGAPDRPLIATGWEIGRDEGWDALPERGAGWLAELAAGLDGDVAIYPAPRAPFAALRVASPPAILVNPVALAALEPAAPTPALAAPIVVAERAGSRPSVAEPPLAQAGTGGNPYSFFGSIAECAAFHRQRCDACLADASCAPTTRDTDDGTSECIALSADSGRGYFLYCSNLALAIATVGECVDDRVGCPIDAGASNRLAALEANASFVDDDGCAAGLDGCLAELFGEPGDDFPPLADAGPGGGGGGEPDPQPRDTEIGCDSSCDSSNQNCDFSPSCDGSCATGSCDQTTSCDADCNGSSASGSSCGSSDGSGGCDSGGCDSGGCGSCDSSGDGGGGGGGGGGCGSDGGGGGGSGCGGSCDSGDGGGGSGCGGSGGCECGSSGNGCQVARSPARQLGPLIAVMWAVLPLPVLARLRRRERRRAGGAR